MFSLKKAVLLKKLLIAIFNSLFLLFIASMQSIKSLNKTTKCIQFKYVISLVVFLINSFSCNERIFSDGLEYWNKYAFDKLIHTIAFIKPLISKNVHWIKSSYFIFFVLYLLFFLTIILNLFFFFFFVKKSNNYLLF